MDWRQSNQLINVAANQSQQFTPTIGNSFAAWQIQAPSLMQNEKPISYQETLIDSASLSLPKPAGTRKIESLVQIQDDLSGITFNSLITSAIVTEQRLDKGRKKKTVVSVDKEFTGKPFSFVINKYMIVGPYIFTDKNPKGRGKYPHVLENIVNRAKLIKQLGSTLLLLPLAILQEKQYYFVVYNNIFAGTRISTSRFLENQSTITYNLAGPSSIVKGIVAFDNPKLREKLTPHTRQLLLDFVLLYIFGGGSLDLNNILVDEVTGQPYIVNYSTDRDKNKDIRRDVEEGNRLFYFDAGAKKIPSKILAIWEEMILPIIGEVIAYLISLTETLIKIGLDQEAIDRKQVAIFLLQIINREVSIDSHEGWPHQRGQTEETAMKVQKIPSVHFQYTPIGYTSSVERNYSPLQSTIIQTDSGISLDYQRGGSARLVSGVQMERTQTTPYYGNIWVSQQSDETMHTGDKFQAVSSGGNVQIIESPTFASISQKKSQNNYGPIGGMRSTIAFLGKEKGSDNFYTYSSMIDLPINKLYTVKTMKIALEKYIARGITDKAQMVATEMWRMLEISSITPVISLVKKLGAIAIKYIGPANQALVTTVVTYRNLWEASIDKTKTEVDINFHDLLFLIRAMCYSAKTLVAESLWDSYTLGTDLFPRYGIEIIDPNTYQQNIEKLGPNLTAEPINTYFLPQMDPPELWMTGTLFFVYLKHKQYHAITWLNKYLDFAYKDGFKIHPRRGNRTNPIFVIFQMFDDLFNADILANLKEKLIASQENKLQRKLGGQELENFLASEEVTNQVVKIKSISPTLEYAKNFRKSTSSQQDSYIKYLITCYLLSIPLGYPETIPRAESIKFDTRPLLMGEYTLVLDDFVINSKELDLTLGNENPQFRIQPYYDIYATIASRT